jgi:hypothetical protein
MKLTPELLIGIDALLVNMAWEFRQMGEFEISQALSDTAEKVRDKLYKLESRTAVQS